MKRGRLSLLIPLILTLAIFFLSTSLSEPSKIKISQNVISALEDNDNVRVIITLKDTKQKSVQESSSIIENNKIKHKFANSFSAEISKEDLAKLTEDSNIEKIEQVGTKNILLQDSAPIINATQTWALQINGTNLTGAGQTVCIIDTGVNYSHPNLGGCFGAGCKIIGGYDFCADDSTCTTSDSDPIDKQGHGTHVAGIVGANGTIKGIAPEANIIMIKASNSSGVFYDDDIRSAIDWCVNNASVYNISVISMSLGGGSYSSYCDNVDDSSNITGAINAAIAKNISVVVAAGNDGYTSSISSPACIENATAVGATTKADAIASYSNRNNLVDLVAPGGESGSEINSTCITGSYCGKYGTSMATPHVAAAIAILQQVKKLKSDSSYTPGQALSLLQSKGKQINDTAGNGLNYSRINLYNSIDIFAPTYSSINTSITYKNKFYVTWSEEFNISSVWAEFNGTNYTGGNITSAGSIYLLNLTKEVGNYTLKWYANDSSGNSNSTEMLNVSIIQANPAINLTLNVSGILYQENININNGTTINISASSSGEAGLSLYKNDSIINQGTIISNTSVFTIGAYNITAVYSETQNYTGTYSTYFIVVEDLLQPPAVYKESPLNSSYSRNANATFLINSTDAVLKNVTLYVWNSSNSIIIANITNITGIFNETSWNNSLSDGVYKWNAYACDNSSNCDYASEGNYTLTIDSTIPSVSTSISDDSILTSVSTTVTCTASDTNLANITVYITGSERNQSATSPVTYTISFSSTGTKVVNCTAYDLAGNSNSDTDSIVVSSSSGGGGSSGGSTSEDDTTETDSYSITYSRLYAYNKITLSPSLEDKTGIIEISLTPSIDTLNTKVTVEPVNESSTKKIANAYRYFSINVRNLENEFISDAEIEFQVNRSWVDDNGYNPEDIRLNRLYLDDWQILETNLTKTKSTAYVYKAKTPGFSTFSITADETNEPIDLINTSNEENQAIQESNGITLPDKRTMYYMGGIIGGIIVLAGLIFIILKISTPAGHDRFHPDA